MFDSIPRVTAPNVTTSCLLYGTNMDPRQCVIPSCACPRTARLNLELLEQILRNHEAWSAWDPKREDYWADLKRQTIQVSTFRESSRDKLLAIVQSFLHKAFEIHQENDLLRPTSSGMPSPRSYSGSNFVLLPPARILEFFLEKLGLILRNLAKREINLDDPGEAAK